MNCRCLLLTILQFCGLLIHGTAQAQQGATLDCSRPDRVIQAICGSAELTQAAKQIYATLTAFSASLSPERQSLAAAYVEREIASREICITKTRVHEGCILGGLERITEPLLPAPWSPMPTFHAVVEGRLDEAEQVYAVLFYPQVDDPDESLAAFNDLVTAAALRNTRWRSDVGPFSYSLTYHVYYASPEFISIDLVGSYEHLQSGKAKPDPVEFRTINWLVEAAEPLSMADLIRPEKLPAAVAHCRKQDDVLWGFLPPPPDKAIAAGLMNPQAWAFVEDGAGVQFAMPPKNIKLGVCLFSWEQLREFLTETSRAPFPAEP